MTKSQPMKFFAYFLLAFVTAGCAVRNLLKTNESLDWNPGQFVLVGKEKTGLKGINGDETWRLIYIKQGETLDNWKEKVEITELPIAITSLNSKVHWNPESVMNSEKDKKKRMNCFIDMWTVLQKEETSILYEWQYIICPGYLHQHEIGRIVMGRWYLWWLSYGVRGNPPSAEHRKELIDNLTKAKVVSSG